MFWRRKKKIPKDRRVSDKLAGSIANGFLKVQAGFASFMNKKTDRLTKSGQKILLAGTCMLFGGLSLYTLIGSFRSRHDLPILQRPTSVHVPRHFNHSGDENSRGQTIISESEIKKIHLFENYMDSLARTKQGKMIHDSILSVRPGLMDSIKMIESIFESQK